MTGQAPFFSSPTATSARPSPGARRAATFPCTRISHGDDQVAGVLPGGEPGRLLGRRLRFSISRARQASSTEPVKEDNMVVRWVKRWRSCGLLAGVFLSAVVPA